MKKKIIVLAAFVVIVLLGIFFYIKTRPEYVHTGFLLRIEEIDKDEAVVNGGFAREDNRQNEFFTGKYIIKNNKSLVIKDESGNAVDFSSLKAGDILSFDCIGGKEIEPKEDAVINNSRKYTICNIRVSE